MDITPKLGLPYLVAAQAQKHVTHNEALRALDALVQVGVLDRDQTAPPPAPDEGDCYIVALGATGAWASHDHALAAWQDSAWMFYAPQLGWLAWIADEDRLVVWDGAQWIAAAAANTASMPMLGINTAPDATNRLAVKSDAVLHSHDDVTPGNGSVQHKLNKAATGNTASFLFQSNWSGRAEFGLTGDDDFHVKVSADGAAWKDAMKIKKAEAYVGIGNVTNPTRPLTIDSRSYPELVAGNPVVSVVGTVGAERIEFKSVGVNPNAALQGFGARSSPEAPTPTQNGDSFFKILGSGYDGTAFIVPLACGIEMRADGNWSAVNHGGFFSFWTTPTGSTIAAKAERMRVASTGEVGIGTTAPTCKLHVEGPARVGSYTVAALPSAVAVGAGAIVYVSNESGGAVLAFSDGAAWRRVTDRAVVT